MPLLCISLLALLLLPLSLSCQSKRSSEEVSEDYKAIVQTLLNNTREKIATLLQNSSCEERNPNLPSCPMSDEDQVTTLHELNCKMKKLRLSHTDVLSKNVHQSIRCSCREKATNAPNVTPKKKKKRRATPHRRKLCKASAILSNMTKCYEMLNTIVAT